MAEPLESVAVPSDVEPSKNSTLPVAVPAPGDETATVAVIATDWPTTDGFGVLAIDVLVEAWPTDCDTALDVLPLKSELPP